MCKTLHAYTTRNQRKLIQRVTGYYNDAREKVALYRKMNLPALQVLAQEHMSHWKQELRALIFGGLNCSKVRSPQ